MNSQKINISFNINLLACSYRGKFFVVWILISGINNMFPMETTRESTRTFLPQDKFSCFVKKLRMFSQYEKIFPKLGICFPIKFLIAMEFFKIDSSKYDLSDRLIERYEAEKRTWTPLKMFYNLSY